MTLKERGQRRDWLSHEGLVTLKERVGVWGLLREGETERHRLCCSLLTQEAAADLVPPLTFSTCNSVSTALVDGLLLLPASQGQGFPTFSPLLPSLSLRFYSAWEAVPAVREDHSVEIEAGKSGYELEDLSQE